MLTISADTARLLLPFISNEVSSRPYICGICIQPCSHGGVVAIATNGHIMGVVHDPEGSTDQGSTIVAIGRDLARALKPVNRDDRGRRRFLTVGDDGVPSVNLAPDEDGLRVQRFVGTEPAVIDGIFPDWRRLFPAEIGTAAQAGTSYGYDAEYLEALARNTRAVIGRAVARSATCPAIVDMRVWECNDGSPSVVTFSYPPSEDYCLELVALLMPRYSAMAARLPSFLQPA